MTPRPHLAFTFGSGYRKPPSAAAFRRGSDWGLARRALGVLNPGGRFLRHAGVELSGWWSRSGRVSLTAIIAIEVVVFAAILVVVARASADPRQSVWLLCGLSVAVFVLSWLRRRALSA